MEFTEERDTMGIVRVPENVYYGAQTQRAVENFPISGLKLPNDFIYALALIKKCAAIVNHGLGLLKKDLSAAIVQSAQNIIDGKYYDQFVVDVFQTGSGTSTNMNINEVIASISNEILTGKKGGKSPVHPNDHVNLGQSSNDVIPSAIHISALTLIKHRLIPYLEKLQSVLLQKSEEFSGIKKIGRTHLQDAVPMTLGQEFSGYARQVELGLERIADVEKRISEIAIGGTAVGTGINTHHKFSKKVVKLISGHTRINFRSSKNPFEANASRDTAVEVSGIMKTVSVSLVKIANDIRWLASGPRCGLGEINIPSIQPGSSIMPGKVNPVIPEAVLQVAAQVAGNDTTITMGGQWGNFELNTMMPVIAYNLLQSIDLLASASNVFAEKCLKKVTANRKTCAAYIEKSLALATVLVPQTGYDKAAAIAKKAFETGKTIREVVIEDGVIPSDILNEIFLTLI